MRACRVPARMRLLPRPFESERAAFRAKTAHEEHKFPRPSRYGRISAGEEPIMLP